MFSIKSPENQLNCVYSVIRPLYIVARLFGFFPFSVKIQLNGKNSTIYFTLIDFIVFVIHLTIYVCFAYININRNYMANPSASPLLIFGTRTLLILGIANGILCIFADLFNRHQIFNILHRCHDFDIQMQTLGSCLNYKQNKRIIHVYLLAWAMIVFIYYCISMWIYIGQYSIDALVVIFGSYFILNNVFGVIMSIYSFFLVSVKDRYFLLNDNLSQLTIKTTKLRVIKTSKEDTIENLMKLAELHDTLNSILEKVNKCYSIQVMLGVGLSFSYMVFCLFSCYRGWIMRAQGEFKQFNMAIVLMMWSTFYNYFVVTLLWVGHSTRNQGKFTAILLHRAINKCSDTEIVGRLSAFSQQINHRIPDANCNLFSFDWTLLYSIVAATVTYLIILIQFDASGYKPIPSEPNITLSN